jgi:transposase
MTDEVGFDNTTHHGDLIRMYLSLIDTCTVAITDLESKISEALGPVLTRARDLLVSIPGFSTTVAEVFLAETGGDMSVFPTGGHLASWTGVSPGANESAGRIKSTKTRPGNRYLKAALGIAAISVSRSKNTYFAAKYRRISTRRGPMKAIVAIEHAMVVAAHAMLTNGDFYRDPGPNYFTVRKPGPAKARAIRQLEALGYTVSLEPRPGTDTA